MEENYFFSTKKGSKEEFDSLCDNILEEAVEELCKRKGYYFGDEVDSPCYIGWMNIVHEMVRILGEHGYKRIEFPVKEYIGGTIIRRMDDVNRWRGSRRKDGMQMSSKCVRKLGAYNRMVDRQWKKKREST